MSKHATQNEAGHPGRTIGAVGKEGVLTPARELELFAHRGQGHLNHMWFGGSFPRYAQTRVRVYVDDEPEASINMELFLGHGIGFEDDHGPWGTGRLGKTGSPSGIYNTYRIPFATSVRVTAQLDAAGPDQAIFWWILRGVEGQPARVGGITLPETARLRLHKRDERRVAPLAEFELAACPGAGMLYQVTMCGQSTNFVYLEGMVRAYLDGAETPLLLSSGLEDYFLGTYYFNQGRYHLPVAGLTHLNGLRHTFSAYRFHEEDPVFFRDGLRLSCRCGEERDGKTYGPQPPQETVYATYVWIYQW